MSDGVKKAGSDLAYVVDLTASIENRMNQVVELYLAPRKEKRRFLFDVMLDSSIVPLGGKVRLVSVIASEVDFKLDASALHKVISFRNAFAHHRTNSHPVIKVYAEDCESTVHYTLNVISSSGKISRPDRETALAEFKASYNSCVQTLGGLIEHLRRQNSGVAS